jgi:hypothetical protein
MVAAPQDLIALRAQLWELFVHLAHLEMDKGGLLHLDLTVAPIALLEGSVQCQGKQVVMEMVPVQLDTSVFLDLKPIDQQVADVQLDLDVVRELVLQQHVLQEPIKIKLVKTYA